MQAEEMVGQLLDHYSILRKIGQGGTATVFLAEDVRLGREVAIKVFWPQSDQATRDFLHRFEREARILAKLDHPHILTIYDYGEQNQQAYLVIPYMSEGSLRDYLRKRERLEPGEAIALVDQLLQALHYAHERGLVHRDIKPGNILFRSNGTILLADFGTVKVLPVDGGLVKKDEDNLWTATFTDVNMVMGTPNYMAPEQIQGKVEPASDLYAIGIILYEMLTGQQPFKGENALDIFLQHLQTRPQAPRDLNQAITPALEAVILRALEKEPGKRFKHPEEMRQALKAAQIAPDPASTVPVESNPLASDDKVEKHQSTTQTEPVEELRTPQTLLQGGKEPEKRRHTAVVSLVISMLALAITVSGLLYLGVQGGLLGLVVPTPLATNTVSTATPEITPTLPDPAIFPLDCPAADTARRAAMPAYAQNIPARQVLIYIENTPGVDGKPDRAALMRMNINDQSTSDIVTIQNATIVQAQVSYDGQWLLFTVNVDNRQELRIVRSDGAAHQTIYCAGAGFQIQHVQWSFEQNVIVFNRVYPDLRPTTFALDIVQGHVSSLLTQAGVYNFQPLFWINEHAIYLGAVLPEDEETIVALFRLDMRESAGGTQTEDDLKETVAHVAACDSFDTSLDAQTLFMSRCVGGDGQAGQIVTLPAHDENGPITDFYETGMNVTTLRTIDGDFVLLLVEDEQNSSQNGLWLMDIKSKQLKQLTSGEGKQTLCLFTQNVWSNISRGSRDMFALQYQNEEGRGVRIVYGFMETGKVQTVAEVEDEASLYLVGWANR